MRPDKKVVVDEVWDDVRIEGFLDKAPMGAEPDPDYSALLYAYRSMRPEDFARFIVRFVARQRNLDARSRSGETLLQEIVRHRNGTPFADVLRAAGATLPG